MARTDPVPAPRHETRDIDAGLIVKLLGLGVFLTGVVLVAVFWLFGAVRDRQAATDPALSPYAANPLPFVGPILQADPPTDLQEIRAHEETILEGYGWVDRERGIVRIPIERAMELLLDRGLPVTRGESGEPEEEEAR